MFRWRNVPTRWYFHHNITVATTTRQMRFVGHVLRKEKLEELALTGAWRYMYWEQTSQWSSTCDVSALAAMNNQCKTNGPHRQRKDFSALDIGQLIIISVSKDQSQTNTSNLWYSRPTERNKHILIFSGVWCGKLKADPSLQAQNNQLNRFLLARLQCNQSVVMRNLSNITECVFNY